LPDRPDRSLDRRASSSRARFAGDRLSVERGQRRSDRSGRSPRESPGAPPAREPGRSPSESPGAPPAREPRRRRESRAAGARAAPPVRARSPTPAPRVAPARPRPVAAPR
jgi:hypothetical protein